MIRSLIAATAAAASLGAAAPALAQGTDVVRISAGAFPISAMVITPPGAQVAYVSGTTASPAEPGGPLGDTKTQTISTLGKISDALTKQGMSLGDVVMMRIFLVGDPAMAGKMDFTGMMAGYTQFFGTATQPNKPARTTVQVVALAGPGALVEIEVQAARAK